VDNAPFERIRSTLGSLTPKARTIAEFILSQPRKAVFMTTKELGIACNVSEATVVRFAFQVGYSSYSDFIQNLRAAIDAELTLIERSDMLDTKAAIGSNLLKKRVFEEIDNLKLLLRAVDEKDLIKAVELLKNSPRVYMVGSRMSYTHAYFMGWMLMKARPEVYTLNGSDSTTIERLYIAPPGSLVVIIATSRYPMDLVRLGKLVQKLGHEMLLITDSLLCPIIQFATQTLVAPSKHLPLRRYTSTLMCLINFIILEFSASNPESLNYQKKLEQAYQENDLLFSLQHINDIDVEKDLSGMEYE
jgi:DNA-binding MurR/RpiR family transcriptional regulator